MGESKHKVALEALFLVKRYVSALKNLKCDDTSELFKIRNETKDLLNQSSLPHNVRQAVDSVISDVLESYIASRELLERENRRKRARLFIIILCLVVLVVDLVKSGAPSLFGTGLPIAVVMYMLLGDAILLSLGSVVLKSKDCSAEPLGTEGTDVGEDS